MPRPLPPGRLASHRPSSARTASRHPFSRNISFKGKGHARCSLLPRTPRPRLDLRPYTPQPRAANAQRQRIRPQRHSRPARKRTHPFWARCGARPSRYLLALRRQPEALRYSDIRPSPRRRPRRRPAGPPPDTARSAGIPDTLQEQARRPARTARSLRSSAGCPPSRGRPGISATRWTSAAPAWRMSWAAHPARPAPRTRAPAESRPAEDGPPRHDSAPGASAREGVP